MSAEAKVSIRVTSGEMQEVTISPETYRAAEDSGVSLSQWLNINYPTNVEQDGTAFAQAMASCGLYMSEDRHFGIKPPSIRNILEGTAQVSGGAIVRPDGSKSQTPAGRILFPAVLLDLLESVLRDNPEGYIAAFLEMVAFTRSINSPKYDQVIINYSAPQAARGQPIAQLGRPARMLTVTTSDVSRAIPTYSIGIEISREAQAAATIDLLGLAIREHALFERAAAIDRDLVTIAQGDTDSGYSALSSIKANTLDAAIVAAGTLTQRAWVKYLRRKWRQRNITNVICDLDTYLAIEGRTGRPTRFDESGTDERLNTVPQIRLPGIPNAVSVFTTETSILGANTMLGLDKSKAIRRIVYTAAEYSAVEEFIMRKSTALRLDWAERLERAGYDEAFDLMTLTL